MKSPAFILLLCSLLCQEQVAGQTPKSFDAERYRKYSKKFYEQKIGMPFNPIDEWKSLNNGQFDMFSVNGPIVLFLGFEGCAPCRAALPVVGELSADVKYAGYKFVYMTFDDTTSIRRELSELKPGNHLIALPVTREYIKQAELALGFPTIYFIDAKKVVKIIYAYGADTGALETKNYWQSRLDRLK